MNKKIEQELLKRIKKVAKIDIKIQKLRKEKKYHNNYINIQTFRQKKKQEELKENCN